MRESGDLASALRGIMCNRAWCGFRRVMASPVARASVSGLAVALLVLLLFAAAAAHAQTTPVSVTTTPNTPVTVGLPDCDCSPLLATAPSHGAAVFAGAGITYTPAAGFSGADFFVVTEDAPTSITLVTVYVGAAPNDDPSLLGIVGATQQMALFSPLTQITNFNRHIEELRSSLRQGSAGGQNQPSSSQLRLSRIASLLLPKQSADGTHRAAATQTAETSPSNDVVIELPDRFGVFLNGNLALGQITGTGLRPDASPRTTSLSGGVDYRLAANTIIGLGGGFTANVTDIGNGSKSTSNAYNLTAYGTTRPLDPVYIDGQLSYGRINFHSKRSPFPGAIIAHGNTSADQLWGSLTGGYEFDSGPYTFGPYLRIDGAHTRIDAFAETGAGVLNATYSGQTVDSLLSVLGFRGDRAFSSEYGIISPHLRIEYNHEFIGTSGANVGFANGAASGFRVNGYPMSRNFWTLGGGVSFLTVNAISFFFDYDALVGYTNQTNHSFTLGGSARF